MKTDPFFFPTHSLLSLDAAALSNCLSLVENNDLGVYLNCFFFFNYSHTKMSCFGQNSCQLNRNLPVSLITEEKKKKPTWQQLCQEKDSSTLEFNPISSTPSAFRHSILILNLTCRSVHETPQTMCAFPSKWRNKEALPCRPLCASCIWLLLTGMRLWRRNERERPDWKIESSLEIDTRRTREARKRKHKRTSV